MHFSHHRTDAGSAGRVGERVEEIDAAKAEGVDCTLELYPYPTGSSYPVSFLPSYAHEGGPDAIIERLRDPAERRSLIDFLDRDYDSTRPRPLEETVLHPYAQEPGPGRG